MGRRSTHTPEQLRKLILDAAQAIIEDQGLSGLSAREIARRISYSPGTIYNMFDNLDDVILNVEARILDDLRERLQNVLQDAPPSSDAVLRLARNYMDFTHERPRLWNILFEHYMPEGADVPQWYQDKLEELMSCVETSLGSHFAPGQDNERRRAARVLWAGVHGITSLSTANKLTAVTSQSASHLVDDLVGTYLAGLEAGAGVGASAPGADADAGSDSASGAGLGTDGADAADGGSPIGE